MKCKNKAHIKGLTQCWKLSFKNQITIEDAADVSAVGMRRDIMDYSYLREDESFAEWHKYSPSETHYIKYSGCNPSVIAAAHKIDDVYYAYANARASFIFADSDDFGDISCSDDASRLYAKTHFLTNALVEYAICLDISWQVVWAFIQPTSLEYLMKQQYKDMEKECTRDNILAQLQCVISQHGYGLSVAQEILNIVNCFDNDEETLKLRGIYNRIKHQGVIHYIGLGDNPSEIPISVNGKVPPMLHRESFSIETIENLMFSYHRRFKLYIDELIALIIPEGYFDDVPELGDAISKVVEMTNAID